MPVNVEALNVTTLFPQMVEAGKSAAGAGWDDIRTTVRIELKVLARRLKELARAVASGEFDEEDARMYFIGIRNNTIAAIALVTNAVHIAAEKIINAVLGVIKQAVNTALGFSLY